ncbi:uncharacterized protein LOC135849853 [Planococcus citri]|uniref:uncharacterized protein LOC135849853 n=1 Tax=Planococcus citri TaxID=170843 RepID=UPI0031F931F6
MPDIGEPVIGGDGGAPQGPPRQEIHLTETEFKERITSVEEEAALIKDLVKNHAPYTEKKTLFDEQIKELRLSVIYYTDELFRNECSNRIITCHVRLNSYIVFSVEHLQSQSNSSRNTDNGDDNVFLEPIALPKFSGVHKDWKNFWEMFETSVHLRRNMTNVRKFTHLKNCLEGAARVTIDGLDVTNELYPQAVEMLMKKFSNPEVLIASYYDELDSIPDRDDGAGQRTTYETVVKILNNLQGLKVEITQDLLRTKILDKFSVETIDYVLTECKRRDLEQSVGNLLKLLDEKIGIIEQNDLVMKVKKRRIEASQASQVREQGENYLAAGMVASGANQNQNQNQSKRKRNDRPKINKRIEQNQRNTNSGHVLRYLQGGCIYCNRSNHVSADCTKFRKLHERRSIIMKKQLCLLCLEGGHMADNCELRNAKCKLCQKPKHQAHLCVERIIQISQSQNGRTHQGRRTALNSGHSEN